MKIFAKNKQSRKRFLCIAVSAVLCGAIGLSACDTEPAEPPHTHEWSTAWTKDGTHHWHICSGCDEKKDYAAHDYSSGDCVCGKENPDAPFSVTYRAGYEPKSFSKDVKSEITELADGANLVKNSVTKSDGSLCVIYSVDVDLSKVTIQAGTSGDKALDWDRKTAAPYQMALDWEKSTGGQVYASVNADFFGFDAKDPCVNAFVKNGLILKDGHNDRHNYDYRNDASDVPASAPMLFGIKGNKAQIAPIQTYEGDITSADVKKELIQSKLYYTVSSGSKSAKTVMDSEVNGGTVLNLNKTVTTSSCIALKVDTSKGLTEMAVLEKEMPLDDTSYEPKLGEYAYLIASNEDAAGFAALSKAKKGSTVTLSVNSVGGLWNGYETILGCRQALVLDNEIAATVSLENTNGAQNKEVPRTCVGILPNGHVVVFITESLWYGKASNKPVTPVEADTHGMSLPEIAEFIYFYGCEQGANFDGGGSSQLVVRGDGEETGRVLVRSSDTGSVDLMSTRKVKNALLVTSKNS